MAETCVCVCVWQVGYMIRFEDCTCQRRVCVCPCVAGGVHDPV